MVMDICAVPIRTFRINFQGKLHCIPQRHIHTSGHLFSLWCVRFELFRMISIWCVLHRSRDGWMDGHGLFGAVAAANESTLLLFVAAGWWGPLNWICGRGARYKWSATHYRTPHWLNHSISYTIFFPCHSLGTRTVTLFRTLSVWYTILINWIELRNHRHVSRFFIATTRVDFGAFCLRQLIAGYNLSDFDMTHHAATPQEWEFAIKIIMMTMMGMWMCMMSDELMTDYYDWHLVTRLFGFTISMWRTDDVRRVDDDDDR